jgi:hemerythrin-like metal-binding protein
MRECVGDGKAGNMGDPERIAEMLEALDDDHARLHKLGSSILHAIDANDVDRAAGGLLELQGVQASHFRFEESLMEEADFPGRVAHAHSHERLVAALDSINDALCVGRVSRLSQELGAFIADSLAHISELDETFRDFLAGMLQ